MARVTITIEDSDGAEFVSGIRVQKHQVGLMVTLESDPPVEEGYHSEDELTPAQRYALTMLNAGAEVCKADVRAVPQHDTNHPVI